jgi:uncharacterized protein YjiS (DUF1127 family)
MLRLLKPSAYLKKVWTIKHGSLKVSGFSMGHGETCPQRWSEGSSPEPQPLEDTPMTVLETFSAATRPIAWRQTIVFLVRTRRLINRLIVAEVARRERQAALAALRGLDDRQLRDFGLSRSQIDLGLDEAAQEKSRMQLGIG